MNRIALPGGDRHRQLLDLFAELRVRAGSRGGVRETARGSGLSPATVSKTFTGESIPSGDTTVAIVKALGGTVDEQRRARGHAEAAGEARRRTAPVGADRPTPQPVLRPVRAWWTRSGYIEQVRDIAPGAGQPGALRHRAAELAELAAFCAGDEPYLWWRAEPWAGKSALLSTFILAPPPDVEVVAFFITARLAAQSDSTAFTDALLDQFAALIGETLPPSLTTATARDAHRRALLRAATDQLHAAGRRLVLLVDGLDEDHGGRAGSGLPSVASLLPKVCGDGLRVVVASRPDPDLPDDVPGDHPLRQCRIELLAVSSYAVEIATRARRELDELLEGGEVHREVLGLVTASGGGLTIEEIEELTGRARYQLEHLLGSVFGRTVAGRADLTSPQLHRVYLFTHETLRETAVTRLGTAIRVHRDRIHTWAEHYRSQGWPDTTPQYLLRGYPRLLTATGDTPRLVALVTDPARHDRMLNVLGGDAAALTEIVAAQDLVLAQPDIDLYAMARLSIHRKVLADRNANIPTALPAVWAALGQPARAEALARSITDEDQQVQALTAVARAMAETGDLDRAEQLARSLTGPYQQMQALAAVAEAVAGAGDVDQVRHLATAAEQLARSITDPYEQGWALAALARAVAATGDIDRAEELVRSPTAPYQQEQALAAAAAAAGEIDRAEQFALHVTDQGRRVLALVDVARAAAVGDVDRARRVATAAEQLARSVTGSHHRAPALAAVARAVAATGDIDRARRMATAAEQLARSVTDPDVQAATLVAVVGAIAATGDIDRAEHLARLITDPYWQAEALTAVARAAAVGDVYSARQVATAAEHVARSIPNPDQQAETLVAVVGAVAATGDIDRAEHLARLVTDPYWQDEALTATARAVAATGDIDRAEHLARLITDPHCMVQALTAVARAAAVDNVDRARQVAADAEQVVPSVIDMYQQAKALAAVVGAVAATGDTARAEQLARSSTAPYQQEYALAALVGAIATAGDIDRAEQLARSITDPYQRALALAAVARAVAAVGHIDRARQVATAAEQLARSMNAPYLRPQALAAVVGAIATAGDIDRAEQLARSITDPGHQAQALTAAAEIAGRSPSHRLVAAALAVGPWSTPLLVMAKLRPDVVVQVVDAVSGCDRW